MLVNEGAARHFLRTFVLRPSEDADDPDERPRWAGSVRANITSLDSRFPGRRLRRGALDEAGRIVANSRAMRQVVDLAQRVAKVDSTVLITGESGAGKEPIARRYGLVARPRAESLGRDGQLEN